jgi:hypothetical protein
MPRLSIFFIFSFFPAGFGVPNFNFLDFQDATSSIESHRQKILAFAPGEA